MKIIVIRHGESQANVLGILSSKPDDDFGLTKNGEEQVRSAGRQITDKINAVYVSPLKRTIQTAEILAMQVVLPAPIIADNIKEIDYGKYNGKKNNADLDSIRDKQVSGDYSIRFGITGESKYDIEKRLLKFIIQLLLESSRRTTVLLVTHGSISNWIERIVYKATKIDAEHLAVKNGDLRIYYVNKVHLPSLNKMLVELEHNDRK